MLKRMNDKASLYRKIVIPVFVMLISLIGVFCIVSSTIIINMQNKQTLAMVEQSMGYSHKNVATQLNSINSFLSTILLNSDIENILDQGPISTEKAVSDYFSLYKNLENMSLLSLKTDYGEEDQGQVSYITSVIVDESSPLYGITNSQFSVVPGLYSKKAVIDKAWYQQISQNDSQSVWWVEEVSGQSYIFSAKQKKSIRNGRNIGIITLAMNTDSMKNILGRKVLEDTGQFILLDSEDRVIYSDEKEFLMDLSSEEYVKRLSGREGVLIQPVNHIDQIIMYKTFQNGWKLLAMVPEKSVKRYTRTIVGIGFLAGFLSILIAGVVIRRSANRVSIPIKNLVGAMKTVEVEGFKGSLVQEVQINEIDELYKGYTHLLRKIQELIRDVYVKDIDRKQLQLHLLQSQINPHFLYNTLDIINCMALSKGARDISTVVISLATVFRFGLNKGKDFIALEDELKQVQSYLEIQKLMRSNLWIEFHVDERLAKAKVVNLIIQPLVENAIVHGFKDYEGNCRIEIGTALVDQEIVIRITDNGSGANVEWMNNLLREELKEPSNSYGVLNVHKRIRLHFGDSYGLRYIPVEYGTCVEIRLPQKHDI